MMRFSVIIPAYNAQDVLEPCVASVLSQEGVEVEIVVVDDGSRDDTRAVAERLAAQDCRVRVVSKPNGGVSSARNAGLDVATGEAVLFVDADDALVPGALASLAARLYYGGVDCLVFGMVVEPPEATPLTLAHRLAPRDGIFEDKPRQVIFEEYTHPYAFRVAFMREFLLQNDLRFDTTLSLGEDEAFLMVAYALAHRVICSSEQLYVYRMSDVSASHRDNASDDVLPAKLRKHLALVSSVLGEWKRRGLDPSCDADLLDWALDLLMLDVSRLPHEAQVDFYKELWATLVDYYGPDGGRSVAHQAADVCLRAIQRSAYGARVRGPVVPLPILVAFYVSSRGISAVGERVVARLRGRGAY